MKKVLLTLMCTVAMVAAGTRLMAQEVTITLHPGWTWISYPNAEALDISAALGGFVPAEGDVIKSQFGNSTYVRGDWRGGVTHLMPGWGYKYYSNRTEAVSFVFAGSTPQSQVEVTILEPMLITDNSAMGGGEVTTTDGTYILVKGLCWATHENPTTNDDFFQEAESGVGTFSVSMTGLNISTTYYVRAYAVTPNGTVYGDQKAFTTRDGIPIVTTDTVTSITGVTASCGGTVTDNGGLNVTARGVCWSTSQNPTLSDSHTTNGSGLGSFTSSITGLSISTTYYVRAYATTSAGTAYGEEVSFTTRDGIPTVTTAEVTNNSYFSAQCGGTVTDNGGLNVTCGVCWSTMPNPTISDSHTTDGSGVGSFYSNISGLTLSTTYYVRAYATTSYTTVYGEEMSFSTLDLPVGAINGTFSVSATQRVFFSQGNLQYQASTNSWKFADNQYDYVGSTNSNISSTYNGWIDLFGWGTSGYNHGANCYQPWSTSTSYSDYYAYGSYTYNLYDQTGQADWGYNPISNGGNQANQWRSLTKSEWAYVFNTRTTSSGIRYAKAKVNDVNGVILLPDNWNSNDYSLSNTNSGSASFFSNEITDIQWNILEQQGVVFLPASGFRFGEYVDGVGSEGRYWSASVIPYWAECATYLVYYHDTGLSPESNAYNRDAGVSVRLVAPVEN